MTDVFSVVQVEVQNKKGITQVFLKAIEGLSMLGQPFITDFCEKPWDADRFGKDAHQAYERVIGELITTRSQTPYSRLQAMPGCDAVTQTVRISIIEVTVDGWVINTQETQRTPLYAVTLNAQGKVIIPLNFL